MYDEIIVPVDGSPFGELALPVALGLACKSGGEVRIVTVVTPLPMEAVPEEELPAERGRVLMASGHAEEYHQDLQKKVILSGCDVPISCHVETGSVVESLDRHVREAGGDLLVMTTHGRGPLRRAWLGSVADGLLRRTPCPILALRPEEGQELHLEEKVFHHLLVTLDGSPESAEILPHAKGFAATVGARITLLRVIPPHFPLTSPFASHASHGFQGLDEEVETAEHHLEEVEKTLLAEGLDVSVETVPGAHPAEGILGFAERAEVDVIAMATHGRGRVARLVLGSVADKVIRGGNLPVLLHRTG
jgi:nucleotide-binding universal stress UspA family protein